MPVKCHLPNVLQYNIISRIYNKEKMCCITCFMRPTDAQLTTG